MWESEAERRERKQTSILLPNVCIEQPDMKGTDNASQCSALYPSLSQLVKVDLDLDSYPAAPLPPLYVSPPQAQQPQAAAAAAATSAGGGPKQEPAASGTYRKVCGLLREFRPTMSGLKRLWDH